MCKIPKRIKLKPVVRADPRRPSRYVTSITVLKSTEYATSVSLDSPDKGKTFIQIWTCDDLTGCYDSWQQIRQALLYELGRSQARAG